MTRYSSHKIAILYQETYSGSTVATENLISAIKSIVPPKRFMVYKQNPFFYTGFLSFTKNNLRAIYEFIKILNQFAKQNPEIIYTSSYLACFAHKFSKLKNIPIVFHYHGDQAFTHIDKTTPKYSPQYFFSKLLNFFIITFQAQAVKNSDITFFLSQESQKRFLHTYKIHTKIVSQIIPNGFDKKTFFPLEPRDQKKFKQKQGWKDKKIIVFSGRIDPKKGIEKLIYSLELLAKQYSNLLLLILYPKSTDKFSRAYHQVLLRLILEKNLEKQVLFIKNPTNFFQIYQIADCMILPSVQEESPLVMFEALACGTPFLGTKTGNMPEILRQITPKLLLDTSQPKEISEKIAWILQLSQTEKKQLRQKHVQVAEKYSWTKSAQKMLDAFEKVTASSI